MSKEKLSWVVKYLQLCAMFRRKNNRAPTPDEALTLRKEAREIVETEGYPDEESTE